MSGRVSQSGGCGKQARGQAAYDREFGGGQQRGTARRQADSKVVHCPSTKTNCPRTDRMREQHRR